MTQLGAKIETMYTFVGKPRDIADDMATNLVARYSR